MAHLLLLLCTVFTEYREHWQLSIPVNKHGLTWSCPWCCADGGRWWGPCSGKTLCGWCSGLGCLSRGRRLPWPHPGLISVTSAAGHGPDTQAASVQHWERRDMLRKSGKDGNNQLQRDTCDPNSRTCWQKYFKRTQATVCVVCNSAGKQTRKLITVHADITTIMAVITHTSM